MKNILTIGLIILLMPLTANSGSREADAMNAYENGKLTVVSQTVTKISKDSQDVFCVRSLSGTDGELGVKGFSFEVGNVGKKGKCGGIKEAILDSHSEEIGTAEDLKEKQQKKDKPNSTDGAGSI